MANHSSSFDELLSQLKDIDEEKEKNDQAIYKNSWEGTAAKDSGTRSGLTYLYIISFFLLIILGGLFVLWYNHYVIEWAIKLKQNGLSQLADKITPLELDKVLSILIGAFGTSLGFIIGYYFKESHRK
ncbi:hypothetical protein PU850_004067 [Cronobacter dublinensis]|uniref:hypothetical protein n=1 Tax=Cronobacter dublinensis TaxID=413497 RepID=UPI0024AF2D8E|nr:hypothetical protein [Cronobacter dublinensis]EKM6459539.1 hypothetical protein [Cronobacter dublinensis]ELQ6160449.1 hypothetical protein [Cronobacter dublinensis]MDI7503308.1 hypothetical protein [Cronobacter dublinensis]